MSRTRYQAVEDGYEIIGSNEIFNRTLYGSHQNDDLPERYFTLAGDMPLFMGAVTDWSKHTACHYAKNGVLMSGLALTPGIKVPHFYSEDIDISARWFHHSEDVVSTFRNGWMEYELTQFSPWSPAVKVSITALPLMPDDGFLVHYKIRTDQRVIFVAGLGGITDFIGRFEYPGAAIRNFQADDCYGNSVEIRGNKACISGSRGQLWVGASFAAKIEPGEASSLATDSPGMFLGKKNFDTTRPVVKLSYIIAPGEYLDGYIVVVRNDREKSLIKWLTTADPVNYIKEQIRNKRSAVSVQSPDLMFNQTVPPTVLALDASWHKNTFYHGAHGYHAPFLGWRNWYGPTVIGWHDRVSTAVNSHFCDIKEESVREERVWYDGQDRPDLDHEGTQYHQIRNSKGFIPAILGKNDIYNMQEVAVDELVRYLQWTGDLEFARQHFAALKGILDWEERILAPDGDGQYQNFLNTWISDGHSYNGGGCTQASAYNFYANLMMAKIAKKLGNDPKEFLSRTQSIRTAIQDKLWIAAKGVMAEHIDTIGNRLLHPSPELSSIYLTIDCGLVDDFQAYQILRFTETDLRNEKTVNRKGRLVYSSNWYPHKYSTCGIYAAENMHLALAYFKVGLRKKGLEILNALIDGYYLGENPGLLRHVLAASGAGDLGDLDFTDVSSMYLRLVVEGLYGINFNLLDNFIEIAPNLPDAWDHASIKTREFSFNYDRTGSKEVISFWCECDSRKHFKFPMRSTGIKSLTINGVNCKYQVHPAVDNCFIEASSSVVGQVTIEIVHEEQCKPAIKCGSNVSAGDEVVIAVAEGHILELSDPSGAMENASVSDSKITAFAVSNPGHHTVFVRVKSGEFECWLPIDFKINAVSSTPVLPYKNKSLHFQPIDISKHFNTSLTQLHTLEYRSPRPRGYSIGVRLNGRYAWEWNHAGHNAIRIDDSALRQCKGLFTTDSGINFTIPESGFDVACASIWDNFPTKLEIDIHGRGSELAILFIGVTNAMQSQLENARFTICYEDGLQEIVSLVNPINFDDWLVPALQTENETVYFSDFNHAIVHRIAIDPDRQVASLSVQAIANEIIIGLMGISIGK